MLEEGSESEHDHQDNIFEEYVLNTEVPEIIKKHGFEVDFILNEANFPLLETKLPDICADRIDYSLRGLIAYKVTDDLTEINGILDSLTIINNQWVFINKRSGKRFAELFYDLNKNFYAGIQTAVMFRSVGDYLIHALKKGYINQEDLYNELDKLWRRMNNAKNYNNNPQKYDARVVCKSRIIDPLVKENNKLYHLSDLFPEWQAVVKEEAKPKEYFIQFID